MPDPEVHRADEADPSHGLLDRLGAAGTAAFDAAGVARVDSLLARARDLPPAARSRLEARARLHALRLLADHREACDRAEAGLAALDARTIPADERRDGPEALRERLDAGDAIPVLTALRRLAAAVPVNPAAPARTGARTRYRAALADVETGLGASRRRTPEEHAGLLDGGSLATRILEEAESLSTAYRRSLVLSWLDLASLMHLPEPPPPRKPR